MIVLIALAFLLMVTAVVLVISIPESDGWQNQNLPTTTGSPELSGFTSQPSEARQMHPFAGGVIKLTSNRVALLDMRGVEQYSVHVDFDAPFSVSNEQFFLAADRDGHSFVVLDSQGLRYEAVVDGRISGAFISDDGSAAIVQDISGSTGVVTIFAPQGGERLFDVIFAQSGYVLSVSFPPDSDSFDVVLINTDYSEARPVVKRFSLQGRQLGQRLPDLDEIYPLIQYDGSSDLVLCGAGSLAGINYADDQIVWLRRFQQIMTVRSSSAGLAVVASDRQDELLSLHLLRPDGQTRHAVLLGDSITNLDVRDSMAVVGSGTRIIAIDLHNGSTVLDFDMAAEIIRVGFAGDRALTVVTRTGVSRLVMP